MTLNSTKTAVDEKTDASELKSPEIEVLFDAGAHIGYGKERRHPKMAKYIFSTRNNVEIFDLAKTSEKLSGAEKFLNDLGREGKTVLWVGTKPSAREHIKKIGEKLSMPYVAERWLGGTLTNFKIFEGRLNYWGNLENEEKTGELEKYSKKERLMKAIEIRKLTRMFGGLKPLKAMPAAIIIVDPKEERTAFLEAGRKNIPVIALLNVDCNPDGVKYPIPLNDNASAVITLVLERLATAYELGLKEKQA